jgi:UDP-glucose 4-epimerase
VRAFVAALDHDGGVFNVGTGVETSVVELFTAVAQASGVERRPALAEPRLGELQRSVLDNALAASALGWRPEHTLADGLSRTWASLVEE